MERGVTGTAVMGSGESARMKVVTTTSKFVSPPSKTIFIQHQKSQNAILFVKTLKAI